MKHTWRIIVVSLLMVTFSARCSTMDGPEAAAKSNFSEWAVNIRVPYRNENFQTIKNDGTLATVLITVKLKLKGEWKEKQAEIQCKKVDMDWQCNHSMEFK
jgi:hypothetical protein